MFDLEAMIKEATAPKPKKRRRAKKKAEPLKPRAKPANPTIRHIEVAKIVAQVRKDYKD